VNLWSIAGEIVGNNNNYNRYNNNKIVSTYDKNPTPYCKCIYSMIICFNYTFLDLFVGGQFINRRATGES